MFSWLVVGGEETELQLLVRHLGPRYQVDVVACQRRAGMPEQTHVQLEALGVSVDTTPYGLSLQHTVEYLATRIPRYDAVVACQAVPDVYPAFERIPASLRPPLIEHGGLVAEALGPKHHTARYVGVCDSIRAAAAAGMSGRPEHALRIPSMVDLHEFDRAREVGARGSVRGEWGVDERVPVVGWVGRLDRKKRVEDVIHAAALLTAHGQDVRFVLVGGPDAFMPEYADELAELAARLRLSDTVLFTGYRSDVPRQLLGMDVLVWLSEGEGMPHVIAEAGAAGIAVVATRDNGAVEQLEEGRTGLFVPNRDPAAVATALERLLADAALRARLGAALRRKVEREYAAQVVVPRWERLFDEVIGEARRAAPATPAARR